MADLQKKLIGAARLTPPNDAVPYAFEKRIMACIAALPMPDSLTIWAWGLWRAAAPCIAITLLMCAWTFYSGDFNGLTESSAADLESAMLAPLNNPGDYR